MECSYWIGDYRWRINFHTNCRWVQVQHRKNGIRIQMACMNGNWIILDIVILTVNGKFRSYGADATINGVTVG